MKRSIIVSLGVFALALKCYGIDQKFAWEAPTNNTDGSELTDLVGYELDSIKMAATAVMVSNRVASLIFNPSSTNTIFYPSKTNAPVGVVTETNTLTGLIAGLYVFQVRAVSAEGVKSDNSKALTNRIGAPKTVPLFITK